MRRLICFLALMPFFTFVPVSALGQVPPNLPGFKDGAGDDAGQSFTPPEISPVDSFGSNIMTGEFTYAVTDLSIGPRGSGGLRHGRLYLGMGDRAEWRDLNAGTVKYVYNTVACYVDPPPTDDPLLVPCFGFDYYWPTGFRTETVDTQIPMGGCTLLPSQSTSHCDTYNYEVHTTLQSRMAAAVRTLPLCL